MTLNASFVEQTYQNGNWTNRGLLEAVVAHEMTAYVKNSILSQAAASMLAQANQQTETVLSLLG